jgi:hypothetical protein
LFNGLKLKMFIDIDESLCLVRYTYSPSEQPSVAPTVAPTFSLSPTVAGFVAFFSRAWAWACAGVLSVALCFVLCVVVDVSSRIVFECMGHSQAHKALTETTRACEQTSLSWTTSVSIETELYLCFPGTRTLQVSCQVPLRHPRWARLLLGLVLSFVLAEEPTWNSVVDSTKFVSDSCILFSLIFALFVFLVTPTHRVTSRAWLLPLLGVFSSLILQLNLKQFVDWLALLIVLTRAFLCVFFSFPLLFF